MRTGPQRDDAPPGDAHLVETRIDSERVFDGALLHVRRDTVRLPSGREATREYITHPGAVLVAPRRADGRWVVERQFRYPVGRVFVEFPAGKIDAGEAPIDTGKRELREEAGLEAARWTRLGAMHPCIGYADEIIELWLAEDLAPVARDLDEDEQLDIFALRGDELLAGVDDGTITDGKTVAAVFHLLRRGLLA